MARQSYYDSGANSRSLFHHGLGRGCGVGRGLGNGVDLGVAVGVGVDVGVGLGVAVGVVLGVGVTVGLGTGVEVTVGVRVGVALGVGVGRARTKHVNKTSDPLLVLLVRGLHACDEETSFVLVGDYRAASWKLNCACKNVHCFAEEEPIRRQELHPDNTGF